MGNNIHINSGRKNSILIFKKKTRTTQIHANERNITHYFSEVNAHPTYIDPHVCTE